VRRRHRQAHRQCDRDERDGQRFGVFSAPAGRRQ